jgi:hypothetical protein
MRPDDLLGCYFDGDESAGGSGETASAAEETTDQGGDEEQNQPKTYDEKYVKALRGEAAQHRKELREAQARLKELETAQLSEAEKKDLRLKELEGEVSRLQKETRTAQVVAAAAAAGAVNPERVARLVDDDAEDVKKAVADLKKSDPYLFARPGGGSADGGAGGNGTTKLDMNSLIRRAAGRE